MAKRTAFIVMFGALALLGASFSLQTEAALAHSNNEASLAMIADIEATANAEIGTIPAGVTNSLLTATSNPKATVIRDAGLESIDNTFSGSLDDLYWVAQDAHWDDEVTSAGGAAQARLEAKATTAASAVNALYDDWYAEWNAPSAEEVIGKIGNKPCLWFEQDRCDHPCPWEST